MASKKVEIVLHRNTDYLDTIDHATLVMRFYNDEKSAPIRYAEATVPKDSTDTEVVQHLLREMLL